MCDYDDGHLAYLDVSISAVLHAEEEIICEVANRERRLLLLSREVRIVAEGQNAGR